MCAINGGKTVETINEGAVACPDPVFVLCAGRSGSTLLRFLLDSHPALTCPPETRIPWLVTQMVSAWSVIEDAADDNSKNEDGSDEGGSDEGDGDESGGDESGGDESSGGGDESGGDEDGGGEDGTGGAGLGVMPESVLAGLRRSFDPMIASYLARTGKRRYCDKSLGGAMHSGLLKQVWPDAVFISLYRHPMDVIGSGVEASPWGLNGYGFEGYVAANPGNSVAALARYWADYTAAIVAAEEQLGDSCLRLRYEDLVAEPEAEAKRLFEFLGEETVPGITETIFSRQRQRTGPGDHKIWKTSRIGGDSVGRGWDVPVGLIPPPLLADVNALAATIGYLPVGQDWGTGDKPDDVRAYG